MQPSCNSCFPSLCYTYCEAQKGASGMWNPPSTMRKKEARINMSGRHDVAAVAFNVGL